MYTKAFPYNDDVIFYYDMYDNKYVAKGRTFAWRTNNPGLVHSRSTIKQRPIGSCGQVAIFSSPSQGEKALYEWIYFKKYYHSTLIAIAKHYDPKSPEKFLQKLCKLTSLQEAVKPSSLSPASLSTLIWGIKQLVGHSSTGNETFQLLPKITARFYSQTANVESYLVGSDQFLSKTEAIQWIETHRLDAVIVHKSDNTIYLRSRPGHLLQSIHLNQKDFQKDIEYEDVVRDFGSKKPKQCIWAFINGIWNSKDAAAKSASKISKATGDELVWSLINDTKIWPIGDVIESLLFKLDIGSKVVNMAVKFFKFLIELSNDEPNHPPIVVIAHSQGAMICELALKKLSAKERERLIIFTFGGWTFIPQKLCHKDSHNFFSPYDLVAKGGSAKISLLLIQLHEGVKRGLQRIEVIEQLITEDQDYYLDSQHPPTVKEFRRKRKEYYLELLQEAANATLLDESISGPFEHSFDSECYQIKVQEQLKKYKNWQSLNDAKK